jgi:hypothetical protein
LAAVGIPITLDKLQAIMLLSKQLEQDLREIPLDAIGGLW